MLLSAKQLACERGGIALFSDMDFSLASGEILQIAGPNGSGKTSLLRILAGLSLADTGILLWNDRPLEKYRDEFLAQLLYLGHRPAIKLTLTPLENLRWYSSGSDEQLIAALAHWKLGGYENQPCYQLSAGQQQRVALTRLLLSDAKLWILDEPFTSIDAWGVAELESILLSHAKLGGSVVLTTHHAFRDNKNIRQLELVNYQATQIS